MTGYLLETDQAALLEIERQEEAHGTIPDRASDEQYGGDGPWNNYGEGSDFVVPVWKPSVAPTPAVSEEEASANDSPF